MRKIGKWPWGVSLAGAVVAGTLGCLGRPPSDGASGSVEPERMATRPDAEVRHRLPASTSEYHVLTVNPSQGTVMISAGRDQGVRPGMTFLVLREGRIFNTIEIEAVFPDMARGVYRNPDTPPQEDDALYSEEFRAIRQAFLQRLENPTNQLRGEVVDVRPELGLVYLDIGERDGVKPEMWFTVMKDGRFVGNVQIREVYDHLSYAVATQGGMQIETGGIALSLERVANVSRPNHAGHTATRAGTPSANDTPDAKTASNPDASSQDARMEMLLEEGRIQAGLDGETGRESGTGTDLASRADPFGFLTVTSDAHAPRGTGNEFAERDAGLQVEPDPLSPELFRVFGKFERQRVAEQLLQAEETPAAMIPAADAQPMRSEVWVDPMTLRRILDAREGEGEGAGFDGESLEVLLEGLKGSEAGTGGRHRQELRSTHRELTEQANRLLGLEVEEPEKPGRLVAPPVHLTQPDLGTDNGFPADPRP